MSFSPALVHLRTCIPPYAHRTVIFYHKCSLWQVAQGKIEGLFTFLLCKDQYPLSSFESSKVWLNSSDVYCRSPTQTVLRSTAIDATSVVWHVAYELGHQLLFANWSDVTERIFYGQGVTITLKVSWRSSSSCRPDSRCWLCKCFRWVECFI